MNTFRKLRLGRLETKVDSSSPVVYEAQAVDDIEPIPLDGIEETFIDALFVFFKDLFSLQSTSMDRFTRRARRITTGFAAIKCLGTLLSWLQIAISSIKDYVLAWVAGVSYEEYQASKQYPKAREWVQKAIRFHQTLEKPGYSESRRIDELMSEYAEIVQDTRNDNMCRSLGAAMSSQAAMLQRYAQTYSYTKYYAGPRARPLVLHLIGGSGAGKSSAIKMIVDNFCQFIGLDKEEAVHPKKTMYTINLQSQYYEGYEGQPVCLVDDPNFYKTPQAYEKFVDFFIHAVNTAPFNLTMPDLGSKGTTYFTSRLIIITSNTDLPADMLGKASNPGALLRRRDAIAVMAPDPDVARISGTGLKNIIYTYNHDSLRQKYSDKEYRAWRFQYHSPMSMIQENCRFALDPGADYVGIEQLIADLSHTFNCIQERESKFSSDTVIAPCDLPQGRDFVAVFNGLKDSYTTPTDLTQIGRKKIFVKDTGCQSANPDDAPVPPSKVRYNNGQRVIYEPQALIAQKDDTFDISQDEMYSDPDRHFAERFTFISNKGIERRLARMKALYLQLLDDAKIHFLTLSPEDCVSVEVLEKALEEADCPKLPTSFFEPLVDSLVRAHQALDTPVQHEVLVQETFAAESRAVLHTDREPKCLALAKRVYTRIVTKLGSVSVLKATKLFSIMVGALGSAYGAYKIISCLMKPESVEDEETESIEEIPEEDIYEANTYNERVVSKRVTIKGRGIQRGWDPQSTYDVAPEVPSRNATTNIAEKVTSCNLWTITVYDPSYPEKAQKAHALALKANIFMANFHSFRYFINLETNSMREGIMILLTSPHDREYKFPLCELSQPVIDVDRDLIFFDVPRNQGMPLAPDITKHFVGQKESTAMIYYPAIMYAWNLKGGKPYARKQMGPSSTLKYGAPVMSMDNFDGDKIHLCMAHNGALEYTMITEDGDCGAPLYTLCNQIQGKIIGVHGGGKGGGDQTKAMSIHVNREYLKDRIADFDARINKLDDPLDTKDPVGRPIVVQCYSADVEPLKGNSMWDSSTIVPVIGKMPDQFAQQIGKKTTLEKSPICENTKMAPAMLTRRNGIDPYAYGLGKGMKQPVIVPPKALERAVQDLKSYYCLPMWQSSADPMTLEESINKVGLMKALDLTTSPGWPWNKQPGILSEDKKRNWLECDSATGDITFNQARGHILRADLAEKDAQLRLGQIPVFCHVDELKDEKVSLEKANSGRTRIFNNCSMTLNILIRKYFGRFISVVLSKSAQGESAVGINPLGDQWGDLAERLIPDEARTPEVAAGYKIFPKAFIAGDYSAYDKMLPLNTCRAAAQVINYWYMINGNSDEEEATAREALIEAICTSPHLVANIVYANDFGNPSGNALTTYLNCVVNQLLFRAWYYTVIPGRSSEPLFHERFQLTVFGDDNVCYVKPEDRDVFNCFSYRAWLAQIGMTYTSPTKVKDLEHLYSYKDITYLKRHFVRNGHKWYGPLAKDSIEESVNWIHKPKLITEEDYAKARTLQNAGFALRESKLWGDEYANEFEAQLRFRLNKAAIVGPIPEEVDADYECEAATEVVTHYQFQSAPANPSAQGEAHAKASAGTVSTKLERGALVLGFLTRIPIIGKFAAIGSGIFAGAATIAKALGRSLVWNLETDCRVVPQAPRMSQTHGVNEGIMLSVTQENSVAEIPSMMGATPGTMEIPYICSTPALIGVIQWDPTVAGAEIWRVCVSPRYSHSAIAPGGETVAYYTPMAWASAAFKYWRGSLRYHFSVTCSNFHSGRVRLYWVPAGTTIPFAVSDPDHAFNRVVDIQRETEFSMTIPFGRREPMLPLHNEFQNSWIGDYSSLGSTYDIPFNGQLVMEVLNPLTFIESPVPSVYINVFLSGGEDLEFFVPNISFLDFEKTQKTSGWGSLIYQAQSLGEEQAEVRDNLDQNQVTVFQDRTHPGTVHVSENIDTFDPFPSPPGHLAGFLQRPIAVAQGSWSPSNIAGEFLTIVDVPLCNLQNSLIWDKARAFRYLRCDVNIALRLNGTRAHFGRLMMAWVPGTREASAAYSRAFNNPFTLSSMPFVTISPTDSEVVEFEVPYIYHYPSLDLNYIDSPESVSGLAYASVFLFVLNPLGPALVPDLNWTMFVTMTNVQLTVPDGNTVLPIPSALPPIETSNTEGFFDNQVYPTAYTPQSLSQIGLREAVYPPIVPSVGYDVSGIVVGERIVHIKDLLMRHTEMWRGTLQDNVVLLIFPLSLPARSGIPPGSSEIPLITWYGHFGAMYSYARGSNSFKMVHINESGPDNTNSGALEALMVYGAPTAGSMVSVSSSSYYPENLSYSAGGEVYATPVTNSVSVGVPYLSPKLFYFLHLESPSANPRAYTNALCVRTRGDAERFSIFSAVGDDFSFGFIRAPPAVIIKAAP
jgi:hypothetical protein